MNKSWEWRPTEKEMLLRKIDRVGLQCFFDDLFWRFVSISKTISCSRESFCVIRKRKELKDSEYNQKYVFSEKLDMILTRERETSTRNTPSLVNLSVQNVSSTHLPNWLPIVQLSDRLKPLKRLQTVSVKLVDICTVKKSSAESVTINYGNDGTVVKVSKSILREHPRILKKVATVKVQDVILQQLNKKSSKEIFMASLKLRPSNMLSTMNKPKRQRFCRNTRLSNIPLSSELGLLLRKPSEFQVLSRIERTERFLNNPSPIIPHTTPAPYTDSSSNKCHKYKLETKENTVNRSKRRNGLCHNVLSNIKDVRVIINKKDQIAVQNHLKMKTQV